MEADEPRSANLVWTPAEPSAMLREHAAGPKLWSPGKVAAGLVGGG